MSDPAKEISEAHARALGHMRQYVVDSMMCGLQMVDIREQLGEAAFKQWLAQHCPEIPWEDAAQMMDRALDSPAGRHLAELDDDPAEE